MKKNKTRSQISVSTRSYLEFSANVNLPPLDKITVKILSLRLTDDVLKNYTIKVTFFDQLLVTGIIKSIGAREKVKESTIAEGFLNYDPSDYEKMCLFADYPLVISIQALKSLEADLSVNQSSSIQQTIATSNSSKSGASTKSAPLLDISCCNVDILRMFIDKDKMHIKKRMEPMVKLPVLQTMSWDNLPMITIELSAQRNELNAQHHEVLRRSNCMKLTLIASYNMVVPYDEKFIYTAASKTPLCNESNTGLVTFSQGHKVAKRFNPFNFYPQWESLRSGDDIFTNGDEKLSCEIGDLQNDDNIDLDQYLSDDFAEYTTVWGSFHRTLMLKNSDRWLWDHLRYYNWPLEIHIYSESGGFSFMSFLNLFNLLYPGQNRIRLAVPLHWVNANDMMEKCGCDLLLTPNTKAPTSPTNTQKLSKTTPSSGPSISTDTSQKVRSSGADYNAAFAIVEVKLATPLVRVEIPPRFKNSEIINMLNESEQKDKNRECTGRGQLARDWQSTVTNAATSLQRVPYYGTTEFSTFNRQLSETRTRVELTTSCWQDAAVYVNNNFVAQEYLPSDDTFEEMLMMSHACLMRSACDVLVQVDNYKNIDPILRAARQARQMQDIPHAMELYLQLVAKKPRDANSWRELSTCMKDVDRDWADVSLNKAIVLNPRHPLSLLSKGCMVLEENPEAAEPFFTAIMSLYPFWSVAWVATSAYYMKRELFHMADKIMECIKTIPTNEKNKWGQPRAWDHELGDWWDQTPLLPGSSPFYDAADLLLRLRAINLAEICVAHALKELGESATYFHLIALCCRLRGNVEDALCFIKIGLEKFGELPYLRCLEAECYHQLNDNTATLASFAKAGTCLGGFSILLSMPSRDQQRARAVLVDLERRQPSAYAWMAIADDWMNRATMGEGGDGVATGEQVQAKTCAAACATQALKWDRCAGRAWLLLSQLVKPRAQRIFCINMAKACGFIRPDYNITTTSTSEQSLCHRLGTGLRKCRCSLCYQLKF